MRIVVTAGGTAGHVSPALAVAQELEARGAEVFFAGRPQGLEERLATQAGLGFVGFQTQGFNRSRPWTLVTSSFKVARGRSAARAWLAAEGIQAVAAFGGYASLPVAMAANQLKVPVLIHEQNATPGMANRQLAHGAAVVALADEAARNGFSTPARIVVTGNPLRPELFNRDKGAARRGFGLPADALTLLVFGGSLGARHINEAVLKAAPGLLAGFPGLSVLQVTGSNNFDECAAWLEPLGLPAGRWQLMPYCDQMGEAYAAADLVLARAGATTLAELTALGKASLLVPYPYAAADEQSLNAQRLAAAGAAEVIADEDLDGPGFVGCLQALLTNAEARAGLQEAAARLGARDADARQVIADLVIGLTSCGAPGVPGAPGAPQDVSPEEAETGAAAGDIDDIDAVGATDAAGAADADSGTAAARSAAADAPGAPDAPAWPSKRLYFIGIAGSGMSGLALLAHAQGHLVGGSDLKGSQYLTAITDLGIAIDFQQDGQALRDFQPDLVVASTAIPVDSPELKAARELGVEVWPRARMLDWLGRHKRCLAVAGTHGKTTTSSLLASALVALQADPSFLIGGVLRAFQATAHQGKGHDYVIEADESDGSFTCLHPQIAIITNIERDHLDHYRSLAQIRAAFQAFIQTIAENGWLVYCADDAVLPALAASSGRQSVSYGFSASADYRLHDLPDGSYSLSYPDGRSQPLSVPAAPGRHNALNSAAVLALLDLQGYPADAAAQSLEGFAGTARRFEKVGSSAGIDVVDDYGHHPTEVKATIAAARSLGYKRLYVVFQPHRYTRTQGLFDEFVTAFDDVDSLVLLPIYAAGEKPIAGVSSDVLAEAMRAARPASVVDCLDDRPAIARQLAGQAAAGDLILTMGAGDVTQMSGKIAEALRQREADPTRPGHELAGQTAAAPGASASGGVGQVPDSGDARPKALGFEAYCELEGSIQGTLLFNEPMSRHTSYRIGGPAALYVECLSVSDLNRSLQVISDFQIPWAIVGKGTNLLVSDEGFEGAILTLGSQFREFSFPSDRDQWDVLVEAAEAGTEAEADADVLARDAAGPRPSGREAAVSEHIVAGAGVLLNNLVQRAFKLGYSGLEFAVGIPGTLGGAIFMNAGGADHWMSEVVSAVTVLRPGFGLVRYTANELNWHYRSSGLPLGEIVVEAELQVREGDAAQIRGRMEALLKRRRQTQPLQQPSAGSIFKNPEGASAGQLIDSLGLKGYRIGDASVSEMHANFIVNCGQASAADVVHVIKEVRRRVREGYGKELQTEIRFLGFR
ncbi:MAG: UDP-N-acetylmuramate--L-alanine ligase [Coriobacteriia bacterium]|nr:UDP-N-acetylmuramate--L-alanine ligase [Coriobacteriia bacterium]